MLRWPVAPMRAVPVPALPMPGPATVYEPKWDGFRAIAWRTTDGTQLQSRHGRSLTRYFPDVCRAIDEHLPPGVVLDGELISWDHAAGRTSFMQLQRRLTAGRGIGRLGSEHPAHFVAFDLLHDGKRPLLDQRLDRRRRRLQRLLVSAPAAVTLCPQTEKPQTATAWLTDWTATGIEGVVAKNADDSYRPGHAGWLKHKIRHTTEFIVGGVTGSLTNPSSLLLGRSDPTGTLRYVGHTHALAAADRRDLSALLRSTVFRGPGSGHPWPCPLPAGWSSSLADRQPLPYTPVDPVLIAEVEVDTATDGPLGRQRHRSRYVRTRPELRPEDVPLVNGGTPWSNVTNLIGFEADPQLTVTARS